MAYVRSILIGPLRLDLIVVLTTPRANDKNRAGITAARSGKTEGLEINV